MKDFITIFSFPLNMIIMLLWLFALAMVWKHGRKSWFVRFMLSPGATYWAIGLFLTISLFIGITGFRWVITTWPFVVFMLYFQSVILFVIMRGWRYATATGARLGPIRWRFLFLHVGLLVAVGSAYWGAPDTESLRIKAVKDQPVSEAYSEDGIMKPLKYEIMLNDFSVSYGADGVPSDYTADVTVAGESVDLKVNHPYAPRFGEDIYLSGYDTLSQDYCILQIVREPWRYGTLAGIIMMLAGAFLLFVAGPRRRNENLD